MHKAVHIGPALKLSWVWFSDQITTMTAYNWLSFSVTTQYRDRLLGYCQASNWPIFTFNCHNKWVQMFKFQGKGAKPHCTIYNIYNFFVKHASLHASRTPIVICRKNALICICEALSHINATERRYWHIWLWLTGEGTPSRQHSQFNSPDSSPQMAMTIFCCTKWKLVFNHHKLPQARPHKGIYYSTECSQQNNLTALIFVCKRSHSTWTCT